MPIANDGQVITAEYHNSLRAAILGLAERLGVGAISPTNVVTYAPMFLRRGGEPEWLLNEGIATKPTVAATAKANAGGWFPVQLPEGARIEGIIITGANGNDRTIQRRVVKAAIADAAQTAVQSSRCIEGGSRSIRTTGSWMFPLSLWNRCRGAAAELTAAALQADLVEWTMTTTSTSFAPTLVNATRGGGADQLDSSGL